MSSNKNTVRYFAKCKKVGWNPLVGNSIVWFISKETSSFAVVKNRRNGIGLPNRHKLSYCKIDFWRLVAGETVEFGGRVTKNGDPRKNSVGVTLWLFVANSILLKRAKFFAVHVEVFSFCFFGVGFARVMTLYAMMWQSSTRPHTEGVCTKMHVSHGRFEEPFVYFNVESRCQGWLVSLTLRRVGFGDKSGSLSCCHVNWFVGLWMHGCMTHESRHFVFCAKICFQDSTQQDGLHKMKQCLTYSKTFSKSLFLGTILRIFQHCLQVCTPIILLQNALCAKKKHVTWRWIAHREQCRHAGLASRGRLPNLECHDNDTFFF